MSSRSSDSTGVSSDTAADTQAFVTDALIQLARRDINEKAQVLRVGIVNLNGEVLFLALLDSQPSSMRSAGLQAEIRREFTLAADLEVCFVVKSEVAVAFKALPSKDKVMFVGQQIDVVSLDKKRPLVLNVKINRPN